MSLNVQNPLCSATLNPSGPNYEIWSRIFGDSRVPLKSLRPATSNLIPEKNVEVYLLNLDAMTLGQKARLVGWCAAKFGCPVYQVEQEIKKNGFPIRAADVIVSFDMRAML